LTAEITNMSEDTTSVIDDEQVRDYLREYSDFFERHPDMLNHLHISHNSGSAVSLVEKQISVLRERNVELRHRLTSLTNNAHDNDRLYELTRKLVLTLLEADSLDQLAAAFSQSMRDDFGVEHASMIVFGEPTQGSGQCRIEPADNARVEISGLIRGRSPVCGALRKEELSYLFPDTGDVGSAAVVPLCNPNELGVIAVGSSDANHYTSTMGTLFLEHIAEVLIRLLPRLLDGGVQEEP
jgi:uncharacterized protein YigA (DUF484 family)